MCRVWQNHRELELGLGSSISVHCLSSYGIRQPSKRARNSDQIAKDLLTSPTAPESRTPKVVEGLRSRAFPGLLISVAGLRPDYRCADKARRRTRRRVRSRLLTSARTAARNFDLLLAIATPSTSVPSFSRARNDADSVWRQQGGPWFPLAGKSRF